MKSCRVPEILLGVLLACAIFGAGYSFRLMPNQQGQTAAYQSANPDAPAEKPQAEPFLVRALDDPVALFTGVLAVFTVVLAVGTAFLVIDGRKHSRHGLRAYVIANECVLSNWNTVPEVSVRIVNSGQTPAKDVTVWVGIRISELPPAKSIFIRNNSNPLAKTILPPTTGTTNGMLAPNKLREAIDASWVKKIEDGTAAIFVVGEIRYTDIFGKKCWSTFRYGRGGPYGPPENGSMPCTEEGNDTEND